MKAIEHLASSLGRRDEVPNIELAHKIVKENNAAAVAELLALLNHNTKDIQHDSIKVLYEIGAVKPAMIADHTKVFLALLIHKNNRLQWGGMAALDGIASAFPEKLYPHLPTIMHAMDQGSVITKDRGISILLKMYAEKKYTAAIFPLFIEQLHAAPTNQLPMYAEMALPLILPGDSAIFVRTLQDRLVEIEKESKKKRVEKVMQKAVKITAKK